MHKTLLSVTSDAKTVKGEKVGYLTGVMYLAPYDVSGFQVCPKASAGCAAACLYTAGRGGMTSVQKARISKTLFFFKDREAFMNVLVKDIQRLQKTAKKKGLIPVVRLNGTSDIAFEKIRVGEYRNIMEMFPDIQFYDYTKVRGRKLALSIPNYHLTFSLSEENDKDAKLAIDEGYNVAVVMALKPSEAKPATWGGYPVVNGDEHDARFIDPKGGHIVALTAKGQARTDDSGFVRNSEGGFME